MTKIEEYYNKKSFLSNSMLGWLAKSPSYFKYKLNNNEEVKETKALENGKLLHLYIESPQDFIISEVEKPSEMMCKWVEGVYKELFAKGPFMTSADSYIDLIIKQKEKNGCYNKIKDQEVIIAKFKKEGADYLDFLTESKGKIALTKQQEFVITNCKQALELNTIARELLFHYQTEGATIHSELPIYFRYPIKRDLIGCKEHIGNEVDCKVRIDKLIVDPKKKLIIINDLKTTSENPYGSVQKINNTKVFNIDFVGTGWFKSFIKYRYDKQAYFYIAAVLRHFKAEILDGYSVVFNFIVVATKQPFDTQVYKINIEKDLDYAKRDIETLLQEYMYYTQTDNWIQPYSKELISEINE